MVAWNHASGAWSTAADWSDAAAPTATSYVTLGDNQGALTSNYAVTLGTVSGTVATVTVGDAATISTALSVVAGGSLGVAGGMTVGHDGQVTIAASGSLHVGGLLQLDDTLGTTATLDLQSGARALAGGLDVVGGLASIAAGAELLVGGNGTVGEANAGTLSVLGGADIAGNLVVNPVGDLAIGGSFVVGGALSLEPGGTATVGGGATLSVGTLWGGQNFFFGGLGALSIGNGGTLVVSSGDTTYLTNFAGGLVTTMIEPAANAATHILLSGVAFAGATLNTSNLGSYVEFQLPGNRQRRQHRCRLSRLRRDAHGDAIELFVGGRRRPPGNQHRLLPARHSHRHPPRRGAGGGAAHRRQAAHRWRARCGRSGGSAGAATPRPRPRPSRRCGRCASPPARSGRCGRGGICWCRRSTRCCCTIPATAAGCWCPRCSWSTASPSRASRPARRSRIPPRTGRPSMWSWRKGSRPRPSSTATAARCSPTPTNSSRRYPSAPPANSVPFCGARIEGGAALARIRAAVEQRGGVVPGRLAGAVDRVAADWIDGWAHDPDTPSGPVLLEILVDDELAGTLLADRFRADLAAMNDGGCAFFFPVPAEVRIGRDSRVMVRRARDRREVPRTAASLAADALAIPG